MQQVWIEPRGNLHGKGRGGSRCTGENKDLHKVTLEEVLQLPLGCRIGKVADVQAATFGGAGKNGIIGGFVVLVRDRRCWPERW